MTPDTDGDMDTEYAGLLAGHRRNPTARQVEGFLFPLFGECICAFIVFIFLCVCPIEIFVLLIGIESTRLIKYTIFFYCFAIISD